MIGWEESNGPRLGAKWVERAQEMIRGPFGPVGEAYAANRDGSIIVGGRCNFNDPRATAWKWTAAGVQCFTVDRPRDLPNLPYGALMLGTSEDGRVIGGAFSFGLDGESLVWFDDEVLFLKDYLRQNGMPDAFEAGSTPASCRASLPTDASWSATGPARPRSRATWSSCRSWIDHEEDPCHRPRARRAPAFAQRAEVSVLGGYTTPGDIDMKAAGIEELEAGGGFTWGVGPAGSSPTTSGFEASWVRQESAVTIGTTAGSADLFDMNATLLHGSVVYRFGADNARLVPFVLAGAGAAFLSADDLEGETKFAWTLGAGLKWFASERVGVRAQARYVPTMLERRVVGSLRSLRLLPGLAVAVRADGRVVLRSRSGHGRT